VPLWDRETGDVDPEVAAAWSRFDLSRVLRERWDELGPKLDGKLSITMGEGDNFLLQGSVQRLARALDELGASARVRLVAGDHFSVLTREPRGEEIRALADAYRRWESARASEESRP
jgi:hypothetical protein